MTNKAQTEMGGGARRRRATRGTVVTAAVGVTVRGVGIASQQNARG